MKKLQFLRSALVGGASVVALATPSAAKVFNIPGGDLAMALNTYMQQSGVQLIYMDDVRGHRTRGATGEYSETAALTQILRGTGFTTQSIPPNVIGIVPAREERVAQAAPRKPAAAPPPAQREIETIVVTAQKKEENIQQVPIAVTALSQTQLTERQVAGGPDLVKEVPNLTFSKTNFSGYNIQIRGIGTQAISVTTDPAVAVALNGIPFIRNHFFEQEFFDVQDLEVLRGPQGTLYGRNATAGVVNLKSAQPSDTYEAMLSADLGNYSNRRLEAMLNLPIVGDKLDLRFAAEWTKRDGYSFNELTNSSIDGRDLWSGRASLRWRPNADLDVNLVWEHFQENDDRLRSGKQLCQTDNAPTSILGTPVIPPNIGDAQEFTGAYLSQGCKMTSLYAPSAFQVPDGYSLPYAQALGVVHGANPFVDPYAGTTQSTNLRVIESALQPHYQAKNDTIELNANYAITPALTFTSQTGYNQDFLWSAEDYNRFNTSPGIFLYPGFSDFGRFSPDPAVPGAAIFCDPQLGCSDRLVGEDLSEEHAWQISQEFRLASNFNGPFNFSAGGNYLHYETEENYYVFINALTIYAVNNDKGHVPGSSIDNSNCLQTDPYAQGYQNPNPNLPGGGGTPTLECVFIDTNPIGSLNNYGHNYFLSRNPYVLNSYAAFGEVYYQIADSLKFTGGLRWTEDRKHFVDIPSEVVTEGSGYPVVGIVDQQWDKLTGRAALDWAPKLDFTDQTLVYSSYARGYKAGGANPPGAVLLSIGPSDINEPIHPLTFRPEFVDAYELGTKNTLLDGALTLNGDIFYYNYKDYQISEIVDRTSINLNFNATVKGAELETSWEPLPGLKFAFAGGYEDTRIGNGQSAIDLMDRTAGMPGWMVIKPFPTQTSNCILPDYVVQALMIEAEGFGGARYPSQACGLAYNQHLDPVTLYPYQPNPTGLAGVGYTGGSGNYGETNYPIPAGYPGFDPLAGTPGDPYTGQNTYNGVDYGPVPNNGEGFAKNVGGNQLPNAPHFTTSLTADYTLPISEDWAATLHSDFYWQSQSFARVFNDRPYDKLHGYSNLNLALILTSANGWQVMGYVKNVFDTTAITGDFLNTDDSGLTTNVFLTDPRLYGVRVTKHLDQNDGFWGSEYSGADFFTDLFADKDGGRPPVWIELGGQVEHIFGQQEPFSPAFLGANPNSVVLQHTTPVQAQTPPMSFGEEAKLSYQPENSDWVFSASIRIGRSSNFRHVDHQTNGDHWRWLKYGKPLHLPQYTWFNKTALFTERFAKTDAGHKESHAILDFDVGKDVGLGLLGQEIDSTVNFGVRFAQFKSKQSVNMRARPDIHYGGYKFAYYHITYQTAFFNTYHAMGKASRSVNAVGPSLSWAGSVPVFGNLQDGEAMFDLGANGAILFGKQRAHVQHMESAHFKSKGGNDNIPYVTLYNRIGGHSADRSVVVPNLGGFAGLSYRYKNAKISFGYRADVFFGAIDAGIDKPKSENLGFFGPFAKISVGLGG